MKIAVLGAGMIGRAMALDLVAQHTITSFDVDEKNLSLLRDRNSNIQTKQIDLGKYEDYLQLFTPFDIIVTAVPGFMGYKTLESVINCGKNVVDISFFPEDVFQLNTRAKEKGVTVITDCGVAPGLSNFIIGRYNEERKINALEIYVGG